MAMPPPLGKVPWIVHDRRPLFDGWTVVLASDATHFYAHIDTRRVFRVLYNQGDMLEGYNTLERLAGARERVIPGHDPLVLERYPAASASTTGWAARVDLPPRG